MKTTDEIMGLVVDYGMHCAMAISDAEHGDRTASRKHSTDGRIVFAEIRAALTAHMGWQGIDSHPTTEREPFLILRPGNFVCRSLVQQVSMFQGDMYPDELDANIYYTDRITDAKGWMPLPPPPAEGTVA